MKLLIAAWFAFLFFIGWAFGNWVNGYYAIPPLCGGVSA